VFGTIPATRRPRSGPVKGQKCVSRLLVAAFTVGSKSFSTLISFLTSTVKRIITGKIFAGVNKSQSVRGERVRKEIDRVRENE